MENALGIGMRAGWAVAVKSVSKSDPGNRLRPTHPIALGTMVGGHCAIRGAGLNSLAGGRRTATPLGTEIDMTITRRAAAFAAALFGTAALGGAAAAQTVTAQTVEVWKSPTCGCCEGWVKHMRGAGFSVTVHEVENVDPLKVAKGVPDSLASCHTAVVDGYVVEGHVPAGDVRRLLTERPKAKGLSAPGMPQSAPGMDMPGQPYDVVLFGSAEGDRVYARH